MILIYLGVVLLIIVIAVLTVALIFPYSKSDLISFGNYLLSEKRDKCTSCECKRTVTHADIENWIMRTG